MNRTILWRGRTLRDFVRAVLWGTLPALIISAVIVADLERNAWPGFPIVIPIVVWSALVYLIHHQIREEVRVSHVLVGRFFKSSSVLALYERERMITKAAMVFERLLERLTTWEQPEIITLEPQRLPIRRMLEVTPLLRLFDLLRTDAKASREKRELLDLWDRLVRLSGQGQTKREALISRVLGRFSFPDPAVEKAAGQLLEQLLLFEGHFAVQM